MASTSSQAQNDAAVRRNISALKKKLYDVTFDLNGTDYIPNAKIGVGAYGVVCSATHKKSKEKVAIKKTPNVFVRLDLAMRTYREIKILKHFKHENIISIREILKPNTPDFRDVYMVLDLMESDLHQIIHTNDPLSDEHVRYFLYQILRGLKYIHSANVIHRDLKPSNLLVNSNCELKIGDFGMARGIASCPDEQTNYFMTQYVSTRWYRAPELMMLHMKYSTAVDVWSVGCIFAEMLGRKQLFPGKDSIHQWRLITTTLGTPSTEFLNKTDSEKIRDFVIGLGPKKPIPFPTLYPSAPKKALDLLSKMLEFTPSDRMTVEKALKHRYLSKYHDPEDEPVCTPVFNFDFEKEMKSGEDIKKSVLREIDDMHRLNLSNISYNLEMVPNEDLVNNTPPRSRENSAALISGTEKMIRELQELAKQQTMTGPSTENTHQQIMGQNEIRNESKDQLVASAVPPQNPLNLEVDASKTTDDVEMLSAKAMALKISSEQEDSEAADRERQAPTTANTSLEVDASKTADDVEMLSAKLLSVKLESEIRVSEQVEGGQVSDRASVSNLGALSVVPSNDGASTDVRMHSAKRDSVLGTLPDVVKVIDKISVPDKPLDAKALIKAAILNGRKPRSMSESSENAKPRITALQRQKQREDKRKKKQERALMKKKKKGQAEIKEAITLSEADRSMLERWKNMQTTTEKKGKERQLDNLAPRSSQESISTGYVPSQESLPNNTLSRTGIGVISQQMNGLIPPIIPPQITNINQTDGPLNGAVLPSNPSMSVIQRNGPESIQHTKPHLGLNVQSQITHQIVGQPQLIPTSANIHVTTSQPMTTLSQPAVGMGVVTQPITIISNPPLSQSMLGIPQTLTRHPNVGGVIQSHHNHHIAGVPPMNSMHHPVGASVQTLAGHSQIITTTDQTVSFSQTGIPTATVTQTLGSSALVNPWEGKSTGIGDGPQQGSSVALHGCAAHGPAPLAPSLLPSFPGLDMDSIDQPLVTLPHGWLSSQPTSRADSLPSYSEALKSDAFASSLDRQFSLNDVNLCGTVTPRHASSTHCSDALSTSNPQRPNPTKDEVGGVTLAVSLHKEVHPQSVFSTQDQNLGIPFSELLGLSPLKNDCRNARLYPEHINISSHQKLIQRPQVDDLDLVQTPKGTGAGYGLGLDLDLLLRETVPMEEADDRSSELDPPSAKLLAEWQELSNMNPRDLEAIERELGFPSPLISTMTTEG